MMDACRLVLRSSRVIEEEASPDMPGDTVPKPEPSEPGQGDNPPIQTSSGSPVAVRRRGFLKFMRRSKPASALRPGDVIRLETGERVVITYVSVGIVPTHRYIEWQGSLLRNWANLPLDTDVLLA